MKTVLLFLLIIFCSGCSTFKQQQNEQQTIIKFLLFDNVKNECLKDYKLIENGTLKEITDIYIYNTLILKNCQITIKKTTS